MPVFSWTPTLINVINIPHQETAGARINIRSQGTSAVSSGAQTSHWGRGKSEEQWFETWVFLIQRASALLQLGLGCGGHRGAWAEPGLCDPPPCSSTSRASGSRSFSLPGPPLAFAFPPVSLLPFICYVLPSLFLRWPLKYQSVELQPVSPSPEQGTWPPCPVTSMLCDLSQVLAFSVSHLPYS